MQNNIIKNYLGEETSPLQMNFHSRKNTRLKEYDYSQNGAYFVTICTHNRECTLGEITVEEVVLTPSGKIANDSWSKLPERFPYIQFDEFIVMPNHIHGILFILNDDSRGEVTSPNKVKLGQIVAFYKYQSTKEINIKCNTPG